jgi:hypothetical protein
LEEPDDQFGIYLHAVITDQALLPESIHEFTYFKRVVPTISAKVDWLTFRGESDFDSFFICPNSNSTRQSPFTEIEELIYQVFLDPDNSRK